MNSQPISMYVEQTGSGAPLVLLHGYPLDHSIWKPLANHLRSKARLIMPDLRGFGQSPAPTGPYPMSLFAADVAALLDELGLQRVVLAGHSMGGYAALAFAHAYPQRLAGLALVASQPAADPPERREGRYATAAQVAADGVELVAETMAPRLTAHADLVEPLRKLILTARPAGVIGALHGMAERPDQSEFLASLDLPTLVIAGEHDALIPLERSREFAAMLRRGRLVVIPGAGHMPMLEAPARVSEALAAFFFQN